MSIETTKIESSLFYIMIGTYLKNFHSGNKKTSLSFRIAVCWNISLTKYRFQFVFYVKDSSCDGYSRYRVFLYPWVACLQKQAWKEKNCNPIFDNFVKRYRVLDILYAGLCLMFHYSVLNFGRNRRSSDNRVIFLSFWNPFFF